RVVDDADVDIDIDDNADIDVDDRPVVESARFERLGLPTADRYPRAGRLCGRPRRYDQRAAVRKSEPGLPVHGEPRRHGYVDANRTGQCRWAHLRTVA